MATEQEMALAVKAVRSGFISKQLVQYGLDIQQALAAQGDPHTLVEILLKKGLLTATQLRFLQTGDGLALDLDDPAERCRIPGYQIVEQIGQGGMASVFSARSQARGGEVVALKVLFPHHAANPRFLRGFLHEARLLSELRHPNLVRGFDYGQGGGLYYMALEHIEGRSLQELLEQVGKLGEDLALDVVLQCARALDHLGRLGITHRDIKPDNMLLTSTRQLKLIDLGFAKDASTEEESGVTCGTVQYISPEQARGRRDVDIRSDIYSLGATLYHLVLGEVPFSGDDTMEVMAQQVMAELSPDKIQCGDISPQMHDVLEKMMAKEREHRYQSPAEIIEDVEGILAGRRDLVPQEAVGCADSPGTRSLEGVEPPGERRGRRRGDSAPPPSRGLELFGSQG